MRELTDLLERRRSIRRFGSDPITQEAIGRLLWAGYGVNARGRRTIPSAGALHPLKLFAATENCFFRYHPELPSVALEIEHNVGIKGRLARTCAQREIVEGAPACIVITGNCDLMRNRYRHSAERYTYLEAGHAAQNIILMALAMGIGAVTIGAIASQAIKEVLCISNAPDEPIYIIAVGVPETEDE